MTLKEGARPLEKRESGGNKMNEAIANVLSDETYTTNEERVNAIVAGLGEYVIPKDKFNAVNTKLKNTETALATTTQEYNDYKQSKMTDDEKAKAERTAFENDKKANARLSSELAVKSLLLDNGIKVTDSEEDKELRETLENIISEDKEKSLNLAKSFISLINKTKQNTANETTTKLHNETPKPIGGVDSSSQVSKIDSLNQQLADAIKNKDSVLQTQLMTQIFEEKKKQKI